MNPDADLNKDAPPATPPSPEHHLGDTVPLRQEARTTRPLNVFLVEDEAFTRERMIEVLTAGRAKIVDYADSAPAAIAKLRESPCDVVILDLELKQGTGFQVLRDLRASRESQPWVVVFTHFSDAHFRRQSMMLGADHFIDKAQGLNRLGEIIDTLPFPNGGESN